jgi:hypothetical protein
LLLTLNSWRGPSHHRLLKVGCGSFDIAEENALGSNNVRLLIGRILVFDQLFDTSFSSIPHSRMPPNHRKFQACSVVTPSGQAGTAGNNPVRHPAQRERLQPDSTGSPKGGKKQPFSTEERRFDLANVLGYRTDGRLKPTMHPVSMRSVSPAARVRSIRHPPA